MSKHVGHLALIYKVIGILSIVGGILLVLLGWAGGFFFAWKGEFKGGLGVGTLLTIIGVVVAAGGIPELVLASGLRARKPWARWLGIVFSVMGLPVFPIGTLLGAYGLRVLLSEASLREFGVDRSWLVDGSALLIGWMYRDGGRRRRKREGSSPLSQLLGLVSLLVLLACLVVAFMTVSMLVKCATGGYERPSETQRSSEQVAKRSPRARPQPASSPVLGDPPYDPTYQEPPRPAARPPAQVDVHPPGGPLPPPRGEGPPPAPAASASAPEPVVDPVSRLEIVAITGAKGARDRSAMLRMEDGKTRVLKMGDRIRELHARVVGINPTSVLLQVRDGGNEPRVVRLEFRK